MEEVEANPGGAHPVAEREAPGGPEVARRSHTGRMPTRAPRRRTPRLSTTGQWAEDPRSDAQAAARAGHVLGANARNEDQVVKAAPDLYPHQWSWDTAFIAIGLAQMDASLAERNLDALFAGQWANGMVPHIVFDPHARDYFPGPERWGCAALAASAPEQPRTSGICQPPLHAVAAKAVVEAARQQGTAQENSARDWLEGFHPKLVAWHRFLVRERVDAKSGLVMIFHGWESGMDNSPRWDAPYNAVEVGATLPHYRRRDTRHVADPSMRPTDREYDRYLWLVEEAKQAGYDQAVLAESSSFRVGDVFFTAIFAAANDDLADLSELLGAGGGDELRNWASRAREAVQQVADPKTGLTADLDLRTGQKLQTETVAGFSPLIAGAPSAMRESLLAELFGPRWAGHPGLRWPLPPSTSPGSVDFRPRSYWRGPVWPCMSWLLSWALRRSGEQDAAEALRLASLKQLEGVDFAEYYEPFTGTPLGSLRQSWTAAVALEWLCGRTARPRQDREPPAH